MRSLVFGFGVPVSLWASKDAKAHLKFHCNSRMISRVSQANIQPESADCLKTSQKTTAVFQLSPGANAIDIDIASFSELAPHDFFKPYQCPPQRISTNDTFYTSALVYDGEADAGDDGDGNTSDDTDIDIGDVFGGGGVGFIRNL